MAANNLRIIYNNVVDNLADTSVVASSTASATTTSANLKKDGKTQVWRSATRSTPGAQANLIINLGTSTTVGGVIMPFCNLNAGSTIQVIGYTGTLPTHTGTVDAPTISTTGATQVFDSGPVSCCPYQQLGSWAWGALPLGVNAYSYGGGTYARVWVTPANCTSLVIKIIDNTGSTTGAYNDKYVEVSRLIIGNYWSPVYNTAYGLSTTQKDLSEHSRTESGDLVTYRGVRYNTMTFDLNWLTPSDRLSFNQIVKGNGLPKPLFISLFPDNPTDFDKEQAHQIYGKLSQLGAVSHPIFEMYSTQVEIEEI